jgi:hypothetical protein
MAKEWKKGDHALLGGEEVVIVDTDPVDDEGNPIGMAFWRSGKPGKYYAWRKDFKPLPWPNFFRKLFARFFNGRSS